MSAGDPAEALSGWQGLCWLLAPWFVVACAWAAVTGREPPALLTEPVELWHWLRGTHPERASPEEIAQLRRLDIEASWHTSAGEARRLIALKESRLPPTLAQQRDLARYRPAKPPMTRASARRFLAERAEEEAWAEVEAWWEGWVDAGVGIEWPQWLSPAERAGFDAAAAALQRAGVDYPLPAVLPAFEVPTETARMQLALDLPRVLAECSQGLAEAGVLRRALGPEEVREFLPGVVGIRRIDWDVEEAAAVHYLVARDRPALLAEPWTRSAFLGEFEAWLRRARDPDGEARDEGAD
jgi:hypothetical protein